MHHCTCTCSVGYKWRSYQDFPSEGLISNMWIQSDSDLTGSINFQGVCVTRLMCSPLAGNFWSTPVLVHKGLKNGVMTSLSCETGLQSWQSCTIALAHSVGYKWRFHWMCAAFDWVGIPGWKLVEWCRMSGATVMQVCASVCLLGCLKDGWKWNVPLAFGCFLSFNHTNIIGGCQCNTRGLLGVGATHLVRCKELHT